MGIQNNGKPVSGKAFFNKNGGQILNLYAVIRAGKGRDVGKAKMALIRYLRETKIPLSLMKNERFWRIVTSLFVSPNEERRTFWQDVFIQIHDHKDDVEDLCCIANRLIKSNFHREEQAQRASESADKFVQAAYAFVGELSNKRLTERQNEISAKAA